MGLQEDFFSAVSCADIRQVARASLSSSLNVNVQTVRGGLPFC
ncbi:hypothetical protein [Candidatus Mesenet endosymbiont of Phosphuga atrata]